MQWNSSYVLTPIKVCKEANDDSKDYLSNLY